MIKRIDLFMPPRSQYGVLHHFTKSLCDAFHHCGIEARILEAEYYNPGPFLDSLMSNPPDCTLSFNGLLPDDKGRFFCDMLGIPHVACIVDSQNLFIPLIHSPLTIIACSDRNSCEFFKGLKCKNVLFFPHGVEKDLGDKEKRKKSYDVSVFCSLIDYNKLKEEWKEKYDKVICEAMLQAAEKTLLDSSTNYVQALVEAIDRQMELNYNIDPNKIDFISVLDDLEMYIKGKSRIDSIKAIHDAEVHIFGSTPPDVSWQSYLGNDNNNYIIHEPVPFEQALDILKETKILLNANPWVKYGAHERIFYGLSLGALVLTNRNEYLEQYFEDEENILFYDLSNPEEMDQKVNKYLSNDEEREKIAQKGMQIVKEYHTWDKRAESLLKELEPILAQIKENAAKVNKVES